MSTAIREYQAFIDGLLEWPRWSVTARWVREWGIDTPKTYQVSEAFDERMAQLTPEQRQLVAEMLQEEHENGIFQVLAYLEPYTLLKDDIELPREHFGYTRYEDWTWRRDGGSWSALAGALDQPEDNTE